MISLQMVVDAMRDMDGDEDQASMPEGEATLPVMLDPGQVRYFHPRKYGKVGTRLSFRNGSGLVVADLYADVAAAFAAGL